MNGEKITDAGAYKPTPEEIREACARIRAGWSASTEQQREVWDNDKKWSPPVVSVELER